MTKKEILQKRYIIHMDIFMLAGASPLKLAYDQAS
ncbi:hypothetical protein KOSB73_260032 [Klebsiella grimontii]|uniref:Uncharacterized protein n=1 Tax=Klebsiella grimontii TaxID=2058152 RepID=A0A285B348_9ENTR|nr:hypothetical protein KOSB73_260032 [Klebsiella grimontii]